MSPSTTAWLAVWASMVAARDMSLASSLARSVAAFFTASRRWACELVLDFLSDRASDDEVFSFEAPDVSLVSVLVSAFEVSTLATTLSTAAAVCFSSAADAVVVVVAVAAAGACATTTDSWAVEAATAAVVVVLLVSTVFTVESATTATVVSTTPLEFTVTAGSVVLTVVAVAVAVLLAVVVL